MFGLRIGIVTRQGFEARVLDLINGSEGLCLIVGPLLRARRAMIVEFERLDRLCRELAGRDSVCRRLMSVPGAGVIVALTYRTGVDAPDRFKRSRDVGAHVGLTPADTAPDRQIVTAGSAGAEMKWCARLSIRPPTFCCIMAGGRR